MASREREPQQQPSYDQLTFDNLEAETTEVFLSNCIVMTTPAYKERKHGSVWQCWVATPPPDMFNPNPQEQYELIAHAYAQEAHALHLKKQKDRIDVTGTLISAQTLDLYGGGEKILKRLEVSHIERTKKPDPRVPTDGVLFDLKHYWVDKGEQH